MKGFSATSDAPTRKPLPLVPQCGTCGLKRTCKTPMMPIAGKGKKKILVIGEAPEADDDEQGEPFTGVNGELVEQTMAKAGFDFRNDCWLMNAASCRPPDDKLPPKTIEYCRPLVVKAIEELKPRVILLLGASAVKSVIGWQWGDVGLASRWDGWAIPSQKLLCWVCPTWNPGDIASLQTGDSGKDRGAGTDVGKMFFERHVAAACNLWKSRPWKEKPQWEKQCKNLLDPDEAAEAINEAADGQTPIVFDYETTHRKPDCADSEIYCCSVSDGTWSYAFPWHGAVIPAMKKLLRSDVPKWGWNAAFEERFTRRHLGISVRNWQWCGMLASHVLDNRDSICSLGFQSFARLGFGPFKDDTTQYLKTRGGNEKNRIREAPLDAILTRCALDSLIEWKLCELQQKEFDR